jgi:DNA repair exonuclease SbcCD ATPase subunit
LHSRVTEATKSEIQNDLESYEKEREEIEQRQAELESQLRYIANRTHELKSMLDEEEEEEENEDWFTACAYTKSDKLVRSFATDSLDDSQLEDFVLTSLTDGLTVQVKDQDDNDIPLVAIV